MITEDYVSYEVAKLLKEKGFDQNCATYYLDGQVWRHYHGEVIPKGKQIYAAPSQAMAMKWFREVHKVLIVIDAYHADHWEGYIDTFEISIYSHASTIIVPNEIAHHTDYEEAVEAALKFCLENLI
jgi:hypothetical protein